MRIYIWIIYLNDFSWVCVCFWVCVATCTQVGRGQKRSRSPCSWSHISELSSVVLRSRAADLPSSFPAPELPLQSGMSYFQGIFPPIFGFTYMRIKHPQSIKSKLEVLLLSNVSVLNSFPNNDEDTHCWHLGACVPTGTDTIHSHTHVCVHAY